MPTGPSLECLDLSGERLRLACQAVSRASIINAESARAVRHYLKQAACHHHVFYEVKCLVGIGKVDVKEYREETIRGVACLSQAC